VDVWRPVSAQKDAPRLRGSQRRQQIARLTALEGGVDVERLAQTFGVTASTIRRDLAVMTANGELMRTYGGAIAAGGGAEASIGERATIAVRQKEGIARAASRFVQNGDTLILDAGTTVGLLARRLHGYHDLTVITNGMTTLTELASADGPGVIALGGDLRSISQGFVGPLAELTLSRLTADRAFLGADSLDARLGICEASPVQTHLKELMMERATELYVLADSSKLGRSAFDFWAPIERPWTLVTDAGASDDQLEPFRSRAEVTVVTATDLSTHDHAGS
jgi:DeoR/GlpR family transcriptional regulator of sugar metabolism